MRVVHRSHVPVIILGHGSSGTSILATLLREYLHISFGTESQFIVRFSKMLPCFGDLSHRRNLRRLVEAISQERWFSRCRKKWGFELNIDQVVGDVQGNLESPDYRQVLDAIFLQLARHNGLAPRWGDKTPEYVNHLDCIGRLFPDAKFIHLIRDGRDVALSVMGRYWGPKNIYTAAHQWRYAIDQVDRFSQSLRAGQFLEMTYEEFLSEPVRSFERLIEFLEIDDAGGELINHIRRRVPMDLMADNHNKWRLDWSDRQRAQFERIAGYALRRHGYDTAYSGPSAPSHMWQHVYWSLDNRVRKLAYAAYWRDNVYKARLRMRDIRHGARRRFSRH